MTDASLNAPLLERAAMRRPAPLFPIAVGIIAGIVIDNAVAPPPLAVLLCTVALIGAAAIVFRQTRQAFVLAVIVLISTASGAVRHAASMRYLPANHIARVTANEPLIVTITGRIETAPRIHEMPRDRIVAYQTPPKTRFVLGVESIVGTSGPMEAAGLVNVTIKEPMPFARSGDTVRITGRLYRPHSPSNPGAYDWALLKRREGIHAAMSTDHAAAVVTLARRSAADASNWLPALRDRARGYLLSESVTADDESGGVLSAMVLGQRSQVDATINEAFIRTGTAHFLAASGMHVGWLALSGWWITRLFGLSYRRAAVAVAILILVYVVLAEPRPSILRAGITGILGCFAIYRQGKTSIINWLSASAIVILMLDPPDVFRLAFQFSFVAVLSILYLTPVFVTLPSRWSAAFRDLDARDGVLDTTTHVPLTAALPSRSQIIGDALLRTSRVVPAVSLAAWIGNVPLACFHFNRFALFGAPFTMLLGIPAFFVTVMGFLKLVLALILPSSVIFTGPILQAANAVFLGLVDYLASVPGSLLSGNSPSLLWVVATYAIIAIHLKRPRWFAPRRRALVIYGALILWWFIPPRWVRQDRGALNVWTLAVGDGTGTVIELPDGRTMLFDFGTRSAFDVSTVAAAFFEERGIREIDTAFVTHANFDHYGAIESIHDTIPIHRLVINDQYERFVEENDGGWRLLDNLRKADVDIELRHGPADWLDPSGTRFEILWPPPYADEPAPSANDGSFALRLSYQGRSILLTGDQAEWGLGGMIARGDLHADILVLPHHGSVVHNTRAFIESVAPSVAIRSSGQRRTMTTNGIEQLVGESRQYFNTADNGCVRVRIESGSFRVTASQ